MRLAIRHVTTYSFDTPVHYAVQRLRLRPRQAQGQTVTQWHLTVEGGAVQLSFEDAFLNHVDLVRVHEGQTRVRVIADGIVEVENRNGVMGAHKGYAPLWLFREPTALTAAGNNVRRLAAQLKVETEAMDDIERLHRVSAAVSEAVRYETGRTDSLTTAEMALAAGHGVCQDHAHVMIAVARQLGYPACYVSGYLMMDGRVDQDAGHAWCAVWTEALGWVGFDVSNGICPDDRYVRVAIGRDYPDAAPVHGIRHGTGAENLQVSLQVQQ